MILRAEAQVQSNKHIKQTPRVEGMHKRRSSCARRRTDKGSRG